MVTDIRGFKLLEFEDKEIFDGFLREDPPGISELTFTNLFMWRRKHRPLWRIREDCLLIIFQPEGRPPFGLFPVGKGDRREALEFLLRELASVASEGTIRLVDEQRMKAHADPVRFTMEFDRDNSDYVYLVKDMIELSGNRYHRKKNHLNQFMKNYQYEYRPLSAELVTSVLEMQESWCRMRECVLDPSLLAEDFAVREALMKYGQLDYSGAAILIEGKVKAFTLGEPLNSNTVVEHFEKADPEIPGLYAAINQLFCRNAWSHMEYVNREQDLGVEGLRKAKESYLPHHMVNKYTLIPK